MQSKNQLDKKNCTERISNIYPNMWVVIGEMAM